MKVLVRVLALIALAIAALAANAYAQHYWASLLFPRVVPRPYTEMVSAALVGAFVAAAVSALPLVKLFASRAWVAGLVVAAPMIALRMPDILADGQPVPVATSVMAWVEMVSYTLTIVLAAWFASQRTKVSRDAL